MAANTYEQIMLSLKKREFAPVYLLHGEEDWFIDSIANHLEEHVLAEEEQAFNQVVLYGKEVDYNQVIDNARQFPMMAQYRLVVLREAQEMSGFDKLTSYVEKPSRSTILLISYKHKKLDARTKLAKAAAKSGVLFQASRIYDNQVPDWITGRLKASGFKVQAEAALLMAELLGAELSKIDNELGKLALSLAPGSQIDVDTVRRYVGDSREYNVFELNNALGQRNSLQAYRIVNYFDENPKSVFPPNLIASLANFFIKVLITIEHSRENDASLARLIGMGNVTFFVRQYRQAAANFPKPKIYQVLSILGEYDLRLKGVNNKSATPGDLYREMVFKILH